MYWIWQIINVFRKRDKILFLKSLMNIIFEYCNILFKFLNSEKNTTKKSSRFYFNTM